MLGIYVPVLAQNSYLLATTFYKRIACTQKLTLKITTKARRGKTQNNRRFRTISNKVLSRLRFDLSLANF